MFLNVYTSLFLMPLIGGMNGFAPVAKINLSYENGDDKRITKSSQINKTKLETPRELSLKESESKISLKELVLDFNLDPPNEEDDFFTCTIPIDMDWKHLKK